MSPSALSTLCQKMASDPSIDCCKSPCGFWEFKPRSSGKAAVFLTSKPSL